MQFGDTLSILALQKQRNTTVNVTLKAGTGDAKDTTLVSAPVLRFSSLFGVERFLHALVGLVGAFLQTVAKQGQSVALEIKTAEALVIPHLANTKGSKLAVSQLGILEKLDKVSCHTS